MLRKLTDRFGTPFLLNLGHFAIVAPDPAGGTKLYPRSLNERYDGPATAVGEGIEAFQGLPGWVPMQIVHHEHGGPVLVNADAFTSVADLGDRLKVNLLESTSHLITHDPMDGILAALDAGRPAPGA